MNRKQIKLKKGELFIYIEKWVQLCLKFLFGQPEKEMKGKFNGKFYW